MADTQIITLANAMLTCLCNALNANPNPPSLCCLRVEPQIPQDLSQEDNICCEGLGYVSMADVWPSSASFPENDIVRQANAVCAPPAWGVQLKVGVLRCAPQTSDCEEQRLAFEQEAHDAQALRAAVCCFRNYLQTTAMWLGMSFVIERQNKYVQGGCIDRFVMTNVQFQNCETC